MKFTYRARTKEGKMESGSIEANSKDAAVLLLQKYDVFATFLEEEGVKKSVLSKLNFEGKVSRKDLTIFFRQLSVMLESRVPVVQSLTSLAAQVPKDNFRKIINDVAKSVEEGIPLSEALAQYPKTFNNFYVNLVKSGEISGNISGSLAYISQHLEREDEIITQIRQATVYPIFVVAVLMVVLGVIVFAVMPRIVDLIKESPAEPPFFTKLVLAFYAFLQTYWWLVAALALLAVVSIIYALATRQGKAAFNRISLKIPFVSDVLKKVFLSRFCSNIATLTAAGISINKALKITGDTVNNVVYKEIIREIDQEVSSGEKISSVLVKYPEFFPSFVVQMIRVGEETGKLDKTLAEVVSFYQKEIKRSIDLLSKLIEPLMIIFLGIIVAILAVSVLSPLYGALGSL